MRGGLSGSPSLLSPYSGVWRDFESKSARNWLGSLGISFFDFAPDDRRRQRKFRRCLSSFGNGMAQGDPGAVGVSRISRQFSGHRSDPNSGRSTRRTLANIGGHSSQVALEVRPVSALPRKGARAHCPSHHLYARMKPLCIPACFLLYSLMQPLVQPCGIRTPWLSPSLRCLLKLNPKVE